MNSTLIAELISNVKRSHPLSPTDVDNINQALSTDLIDDEPNYYDTFPIHRQQLLGVALKPQINPSSNNTIQRTLQLTIVGTKLVAVHVYRIELLQGVQS